ASGSFLARAVGRRGGRNEALVVKIVVVKIVVVKIVVKIQTIEERQSGSWHGLALAAARTRQRDGERPAAEEGPESSSALAHLVEQAQHASDVLEVGGHFRVGRRFGKLEGGLQVLARRRTPPHECSLTQLEGTRTHVQQGRVGMLLHSGLDQLFE